MIDIKELSIGNWVNYRPGWKDEETGQIVYESGTEFPVKIEMMYFCQGEGLVQYNDGQNDGIEACDYELFPIEITPEILEKNGFINDFYVDEAVADYHFVRLEGYSLHIKELQQGGDDALVSYCNGSVNIATELNGEINKEIHFVHQLQNALTLCGIPKNIRL